MKNNVMLLKLVLLLFLCLSILHPLITGATDITPTSEVTPGNTDSIIVNAALSETNSNSQNFVPDHFIQTNAGICYGISEAYGFLYSMDAGKTWVERNNGLPFKLIYPFQKPQTRYLTSLGVDPLNVARVAVTTTNTIYLSEDYGNNWTKIGICRSVPSSTYLTAVALSPTDKNTILIGTSYDGIFETRNKGGSWSSVTTNLRFLYKGANFWEEISALVYHPVTGEIVFACGYPGTSVLPGLYRLSQNRRTAQKINLRGLKTNAGPNLQSDSVKAEVDGAENNNTVNNQIKNTQSAINRSFINVSDNTINQVINSLYFKSVSLSSTESQGQNAWFLQAGAKDGGAWLYPWAEVEVSGDKVQNEYTLSASLKVENNFLTHVNTVDKVERMKRASAKFGLYVRWDYAIGKKLDGQLSFAKKNGLNAIVVDLKDDDGYLTYDSQLPMALKIGAVRKNYGIKIGELLKKAKDNGIYVIGRLVTFKDERLYRYQNFKYAIWDRVTNKPWESWSKKEFWVDPYSQDVWDYNIAIAEELQSLGIDEIQFDYIRFPTDGNIGQALYHFRPADNGVIQAERKDAIESFLAKVREKITIPISVDLYGYNCWCRMDGVNGQNVELMSKFVDAVCPMFYPSHFPNAFLKDIPYLERARVLYQDGGNRADAIVEGRCLIRPYVQTFLLGGERKMTAPTFTKYVVNQLEGVFASPTPGFTYWNYGMDYYMVKKEVSDYLLEKQK